MREHTTGLIFSSTVCFRGPKGACAVPGGKDSGWPQFLCAICQSYSARSAHPDLSGVVSHAAAESTGASVQHALRPPAGHTAHHRGAHSALPQVSAKTTRLPWHIVLMSHLYTCFSFCFTAIQTWQTIHDRV